ncbi:MAG: right-handed parallel beta-helix repeat-containing protein [Phycisphaerales bacterium]|nr:right-handed parallel beta-helix repeat-containing protein [Phycisphaerales bacterium]
MNDLCRTLLAAAALACSSATVSAETITVCADGCDYTFINAAIDAANDGDVIQLAAETYFEGEQIDTLGKAITLRGVLDKAGEPASVLDGAGAHRVLICRNGETEATVFERLVIQNGSDSSGGGMYNYYGSPTLVDCTFAGNSAGYGGGMFNQASSSPTLADCTFTSNSVEYYGGGMFNRSSSLTLAACTFTNNSAEYGGGMFNHDGGSPTLADCMFTGNAAVEDGGGMYNEEYSSPTLTNCTFTGNSADDGGGMYSTASSSPALADCTLCGNDSENVSGGFANLGGNCLAYSCDDSDGDGTPDKCVADGSVTLLVPSEYARIEDAVEAAGYGDVVLVEAGVYFPSRTIDPGGKPITIRGAVDSAGRPATIIDGGGAIRLLECGSGELADTVFENLLVQNGNGEDTDRGGGMYNNGSSPTLINCTFTSNAARSGGGMSNSGSSPILIGCAFEANSATRYGGGMYNSFSSPTLTTCTFTGNSGAQGGGGLYNHESNLTLTNCTFEGNSRGGLDNQGSGILILTGCTFTRNSSTTDGGGVRSSNPGCSGGGMTLANCVFTGNSANESGGGIYSACSNTLTLTDCTFTNNSAEWVGGGVSGSSMALTNCTFTGNSSTDRWGGGLSSGGSSTLADCTFTGNSSVDRGGGIFNGGSLALAGCTLCGNDTDNIFGGFTDLGGNCLAYSCDDSDGDGTPDKCVADGSVTLLVPSEYARIEDAVEAAGYGDVVLVEAGVYFPSRTIDPGGKPITIRGAVDSAGRPATIIDGGGGIRLLQCSSGESADTVFENLLVQNGDDEGTDRGGGMYNNGSSPTLTNCMFTGNSASIRGGGMYNESSSPTLTNCTFTGNSARSGGGMYNYYGSSPTLVDCTFTSNSAEKNGGGMYNTYFSSPTLADCTLCGNASGQIHGGFTDLGGNCLAYSCDDSDGDGTPDKCVADGSVTLLVPSEYAGIEDAVEAAGYGDVVLVEAGVYFPSRTIDPGGKPITIRGAVDSAGRPATIVDGEGVIRLLQCSSGESADNVFENLLIQNGYAEDDGGGMYNYGSSPTLINCTFTGNSADKGGGMGNDESSPTLVDCTFTSNSAYINGGGMRNYFSDPVLTACTLCDNTPNQISGAWDDGGSNCVATSCDDCDLPSDACPTDLDLNGITDGGDLGVFFVHWGECQVEDCPADFNDDEVVDGIDLGILFSAWGPCQ